MKNTKQHILATAKHLFYEQGYEATTIKDIAEHVGIANSVIFHYFKNKRDILIHVFKDYDKTIIKLGRSLGPHLNPIERSVLVSKMYLLHKKYDEKTQQMFLTSIKENIVTELLYQNFFQTFKELMTFQGINAEEDPLLAFRYMSFIGSIEQIQLNFINGKIKFTEENIDLSIMARFKFIFGVEPGVIKAALQKVKSVLNAVTFSSFDVFVTEDQLTKYLYRHYETNFTEIVVASIDCLRAQEDLGAALKERYQRLIVITKNYPLGNVVDTVAIETSLGDFKKKVISLYEELKAKFTEQEIFLTGVVDSKEARIKPVEDYGIEVAETLDQLKVDYYLGNKTITHCALLFYTT
ncbi:MAG TPA: TetR/AcrR family transcriptional regulator [Oscillospiraceae bacterium]|nr:TetR/AcrR family transcriptional regulator [Oscillospiraceae bacterium]